jgi:hypothetical protein
VPSDKVRFMKAYLTPEQQCDDHRAVLLMFMYSKLSFFLGMLWMRSYNSVTLVLYKIHTIGSEGETWLCRCNLHVLPHFACGFAVFWVIRGCISSWYLPGSAISHRGCLRTVAMGLKIVNDRKILYSCVPR